jgi:pilus assembly protein Flp/PilA
MNAIRKFWQEEEAATAMEYGLILGLAAAVIFTGIAAFYGGLNYLFNLYAEFFYSKKLATSS